MRSTILSVILLPLFGMLYGQSMQNIPKGKFTKDSLKVGELVHYHMVYSYQEDTELIFPDSTYNFFPFEYVEKVYFPTRIDSTLLTDSVIYTLRTFETDSVLYLRVPVFIINEEGDSLSFYTEADSVIYQPTLINFPEKLEIKADTTFSPVELQFNYIYFLIALAVIALLIGLIIALFGRRMYQWYKITRLKRSHKKFQSRYTGIMKTVSTGDTKKVTEEILSVWKKYMERTEQLPITKYTSKEISRALMDEELQATLRELDKNIYGNYRSENIELHYNQLLHFSAVRLKEKIEEVKHG